MSAVLPTWLREERGGVTLALFIQPRASRTEVVGPHGEPPRLKLRVAGPPVDGAANDEVLRFLKKTLGIPASRITLVRGQASRKKDVFCAGLAASEVFAALAPQAAR